MNADIDSGWTWKAEDLSDHMSRAIASSELRTHPSPHLFVENVFPEDFYLALRSRLPTRRSTYQGWGIGKHKGQFHYQQRKQIYIHNRQRLLSSDLGDVQTKAFWLALHDWFMTRGLQSVILAPFETQLRERFGGELLPPAGDVVTNGMINFHEAGYFIGPHPDTRDRIATAIFYLAEDDAPEDIGTHFYVPKNPAYRSDNHGKFEDFDRVSTAPYRRNSAVIFLRTPQSYHGVELFTEAHAASSERYVLQYMLIHRSAGEAAAEA